LKRTVMVLIFIMLIFSQVWCQSYRKFHDPESVITQWEESFRSHNLDVFADCYWENAEQWWLLPDGRLERNEGIGSIIERQQVIIDELGPDSSSFRLPEPQIHPVSYTGFPLLIYDDPELGTTNVFWFEERFGRIRIARQLLIVRYFNEVEAGDVQIWADENKDGILQREEQRTVYEALWRATQEPHQVSNPLDEFCDWNVDGRIEVQEIHLARAALIRDSLRQGYIHFPEFSHQYLDQNRSGSIDLGEADMAFELIYGEPGNRPVDSLLTENIDFIPDGIINSFEREVFSRIVTRLVATIPEWPVFEQLSEKNISWVVTWADANGDGFIGEEELWDIGGLMHGAITETDVITSPIGLYYDNDRDLKLSPSEQKKATDMMMLKYLPETMNIKEIPFNRITIITELDLNDNSWLDPEEIEEFIEVAMNQEKLINRRVDSELEKRIDREPKDSYLDEWEVYSFTGGVFATIAEIWLIDSSDVSQSVAGLTNEALSTTVETRINLQEFVRTVEPDEEQTAVTKVTQLTGKLIAEVSLDPVYPILYKYYDTAPVGKVVIRNGTSKTLSDLQVQVDIQRYIDNPRLSTRITSLGSGEEITVKLQALFNQNVLDLTEGTRCSARVLISYQEDGEQKQLAITETLTLYDRNAIRWDDSEKVASFVTARDPQIRLLATNMAAVIRREKNESISDNLQNAMVLYSAMIQHNLGYNIDPTSSYRTLSGDNLQVDYIQFPRQTLIYKGGDCDDLSVCYSALLEAIGIPSAFITIPGHIYVAVGLKMDASTARSRFSNPNDLIFAEDGSVWIPVEITKLNDRNPEFLEAWEEGAKEWREHSSRNQAELLPTRTAWESYEPVAASFMTETVALPDSVRVLNSFQSELKRFIGSEIADRELTIKGRLSSDINNPRLLNLLGTLYARYGINTKARVQFNTAISNKEYFASLMNLGHLDFLDEEYIKASSWYQRALSIRESDAYTLLALARTDHELENYGNVKHYYSKLQQINPQLASDYIYLDLRASDSVRAQESTRLRKYVIWVEEEN
jgi:hypothetical protein